MPRGSEEAEAERPALLQGLEQGEDRPGSDTDSSPCRLSVLGEVDLDRRGAKAGGAAESLSD